MTTDAVPTGEQHSAEKVRVSHEERDRIREWAKDSMLRLGDRETWPAVALRLLDHMESVERDVKTGFVVFHDPAAQPGHELAAHRVLHGGLPVLGGARRCFETLEEAEQEAARCAAQNEEHVKTGRWYASPVRVKRYRQTFYQFENFETFDLVESPIRDGLSDGPDDA